MSADLRCTCTTFLWCVALVITLGDRSISADDSAADVYRQRVVPLVRGNHGNSCRECHLQGVELGDVLTEDPAQTFAELRRRGLDRSAASRAIKASWVFATEA